MNKSRRIVVFVAALVLVGYVAFTEIRAYQTTQRMYQAEQTLLGNDLRAYRPRPLVEPHIATASLSDIVLKNTWDISRNDGSLDTLRESNNNMWDVMGDRWVDQNKLRSRIEELERAIIRSTIIKSTSER